MTQTYEAWRITYQSSEQAARAAFERMMELEQGKCLHQIAEPAAIHPDDAAVDALAEAMKAKLAKQRAKGYGGWDTDCTQERLSELLREHVDKGDPVDVANFCAFLLARGEGIAAAPQAVQPAVPLPLLVRDIARDLGITVPEACIALKPLGTYSTNSAVTAEMARMLRAHLRAGRAHPAEGVPAQDVSAAFKAWAEVKGLIRVSHGISCEWTSLPVVREAYEAGAAWAATQPAAQGLDAQDAARYRFIKKHSLILSGGTREFGWPISPFGVECDRYIDKELAAQAKQGGA